MSFVELTLKGTQEKVFLNLRNIIFVSVDENGSTVLILNDVEHSMLVSETYDKVTTRIQKAIENSRKEE